jgi:serine/threonine-protein kinase RsbW
LYDQLGDGIPKEALLALDLGLQECLANTIIHGSPAAAIRVSLRRFEDRVEIEVEDDGIPFDPLGAVLPPLPTQLEDMALGGNGIRLMRRFLDEMSYRYSSGRNHLVMVRRTGPRTEE